MDCVNGNGLVVERLVTARRVEEERRIDCLPRHFGVLGIVAERTVYASLAFMCERYTGGYWHYYELSNGGFYMAPHSDEPYRLVVETNGYEGTLSPDAAGIVACAMAFSHLSFSVNGPVFSDAFHQLRDFALQHVEAREIMRALD